MGWPSTQALAARVCVLLETSFQFILAPGAPPLPPLGHPSQDLARVRGSSLRSTASASSAATRTRQHARARPADDDARFHDSDRQQAYVHARGDSSDPPKTRIDYSWVQEERERWGGARRN